MEALNAHFPRNPMYIFDLDGTLSNLDHRRPMVEGKKDLTRNDWIAFYLACKDDKPVWPVIGTMMQLWASGNDIRIWSGRGAESRGNTLMWLHAWTAISLIQLERMLQMRPENDTTPDHQLKRKWLNALTPHERSRLVAVFDDRDKVVEMWRGEGIACFQVAPGNF
jgi:hypothetical protein